jgi:hypothetical protein
VTAPLEPGDVAALREIAARVTASNGGRVSIARLPFDAAVRLPVLAGLGLVERSVDGSFTARLTPDGIDALAAAPAGGVA